MQGGRDGFSQWALSHREGPWWAAALCGGSGCGVLEMGKGLGENALFSGTD